MLGELANFDDLDTGRIWDGALRILSEVGLQIANDKLVAKLTGKIGDYQMGVLNIQTEAEAGMPSTNYGVVRMKK